MPEKPTARKVVEQEEQRPSFKIDLRDEAGNLPGKPRSAIENYLERKVEVTQQDYEEFLQYQQEKARQNEAGQARRPVADVAEPARASRHWVRAPPIKEESLQSIAPRDGTLHDRKYDVLVPQETCTAAAAARDGGLGLLEPARSGGTA